MGYKTCEGCEEQILVITGKSEFCAFCGGKLQSSTPTTIDQKRPEEGAA